jgi:hypothetical protein
MGLWVMLRSLWKVRNYYMIALTSLLERGLDTNARDASNETLLDRAAAKGNFDVVRLLIERGAEVDSCDKWGWTPLYSASIWRGRACFNPIVVNHTGRRGNKMIMVKRKNRGELHEKECS